MTSWVALLLFLLASLGAGEAALAQSMAPLPPAPPGSAAQGPSARALNLRIPEGASIVTQTPGFRIVAFPAGFKAALRLVPLAVRYRAELADSVGEAYAGQTELRIATTRSAFAAMHPKGVHAASWAAGVAFPASNLIVLDVRPRGGRQRPEQILLHELSHLALGRLSGTGFPRWFLEGMAVYHAGAVDPARFAALASASLRDGLLPLDELGRGWPQDPVDVQLAYAEAVDFVGWLFRTRGKLAVHRLVRAVAQGAPFEKALETGTGLPFWKLERHWHDDLRIRFTWIPVAASSGTLWVLTTGLFLLAYRTRRRALVLAMSGMEDKDPPSLEDADPPLLEDEDPPLWKGPESSVQIPADSTTVPQGASDTSFPCPS